MNRYFMLGYKFFKNFFRGMGFKDPHTIGLTIKGNRVLPFVSILTDYQPQWKKPLPGATPKSLKGKTMDLVFPSSWLRHKKQLSDEVYNRRAVTLWFYFKAFYGMADEELLSYL